jgi:CheY-like chemotaxis protein
MGTTRRALVVDDSKSARAFLTRILERYELAVDGVESAEQAIEYLTVQRPDVIFMDHLMPGMDGFQAVQSIKNNPRTATIPIMMYTSQEGELYLGQARALGAVGVLPKQIKHADVSKVLEQLHLVGEAKPDLTGEHALAAMSSDDGALSAEAAASGAGGSAGGDSASGASGAAATADADGVVGGGATPAPSPGFSSERRGPNRPMAPPLATDMRLVIEGMLAHHMMDVRRFIVEHLESSADRVVADVRLMLQDQASQPVVPALPPERPTDWRVWLAVAGLVAAFLFGLQWSKQRGESEALAGELTKTQQQLADSQQTLLALQTQVADATADSNGPGGAASQAPDAAPTNAPAAAEAMRGATIVEAVPFGETPLAGARQERVQALLNRLTTQGFHGVVQIRSIPGRFCTVTGPSGTPVLGADALPAAKCEQINPRDDNGSASQRQSVAFANMVATARQNAGGKIDVQISAGSPDEVATAYPALSDTLTAGEWNRVAASNNRVEVHWQPTR